MQVRIYGDGSVTSPTKWWAALGGYGVWMPAWNIHNESNPQRNETTYHGPAIGKTLTSTRLELMAWIRVLAIPIRGCYATDSASMLGKAIKLIKAVEDLETQIRDGKKVSKTNPFKKAWAAKGWGPVGASMTCSGTKRCQQPNAKKG